jgi:hypothetical protein
MMRRLRVEDFVNTCVSTIAAATIERPSNVRSACLASETKPPTPKLIEAIAFEKTNGTVLPGDKSDPVHIVLGRIAMPQDGRFRIQALSLQHDPATSFEVNGANAVTLPVTSYHAGGSGNEMRVTITLNAAEMRRLNIVPGQELLLRQVDASGNASDAILVRIKPKGWDNINIEERSLDEKSIRVVRGREIAIPEGLFGVPGHPQGTITKLLGRVTDDVDRPVINRENVTCRLISFTPEEFGTMAAIAPHLKHSISYGDLLRTQLEEAGAEIQPWHQVLIDNDALFRKLATAFDEESTDRISPEMLAPYPNPSMAKVVFDKAVAPGTSVFVKNQRTGEVVKAQLPAPDGRVLTDADRRVSMLLRTASKGDPIVVTYHDPATNWGEPYGFLLSDRDASGKCAPDLLSLRFAKANL